MAALWNFLFHGELDEPVFRYRRMKVSRTKEGDSPNETTRPQEESVPEHLKFKLIMHLSRALTVVLVLCFIGIFALLFTDRDVPQFLTLMISAIIGYFGGAITAYLGLQKLKRA